MSFICGVVFVFLSEVVLREIPRDLLNSEAISTTGWKLRCFDGGIGMTTSGQMLQFLKNPATASTIAGTTLLSPLYFRRYTSSPRGDRSVSNSGWPNSLYPIMVLDTVCTSRTYPWSRSLNLFGVDLDHRAPSRSRMMPTSRFAFFRGAASVADADFIDASDFL